MSDSTTSTSAVVMDVDGTQHPSSPSTCSPSQHVPGTLISPISSHVDFSFIPHTKMNPMLPALALSRRCSLACILEDPKSTSLPLEKRTNDSLYPPGQLESDDDLSIHISKVQVVEESAQTAAHRLGEVKAQVDELRIAPEAEELCIARADHARLVEDLANLMRTFDNTVTSQITSCLVDDHRIQDAKEHAQTAMMHVSMHCQSVSDQLSHHREQRQQAIADGVTRQIQEDGGAMLTEVLSQLPPLHNRMKDLHGGLDTSVKDEVQKHFQWERLTQQRKSASLLNTMQASLDEKFTQFTDQCHQDKVAMEGDLACALSEATTSEKGYASVLNIA
ncbi:uncharacterized protein ARMOST_04129 [Armillaria ostoyae]|uniref:Uncharacterized protein n=1 Tax=Armillaria ostoyae TaxID=47428 RepID=A0A284QWH5_ARMOS|nr:uncharacterized protein ARMOST_04129 [Armillaria ostoyae]